MYWMQELSRVFQKPTGVPLAKARPCLLIRVENGEKVSKEFSYP